MASTKKIVKDGKEVEVAQSHYEPGLFDSPLPLRYRQRFTKKAVAKALHNANGLLAVAARNLGCSRSTLQSYLKKYPDLHEELQQIRDSYVDLAESSLIKQIQEKNTTATIFLLKCLGKGRGWIESPNVQLHAHVDGSGTWADIMKRVVSQAEGGRIVPTEAELTRLGIIDVTAKKISASACTPQTEVVVAVEEEEEESGGDE